MGNTQIKEKYINDIKNEIEYDSYKIFGLSKNFTWDELKRSYKKLALKAHPDKGGDKIIFDYLTNKFYELSNDYKMRTNNKNYNELKNDFNDFIHTNKTNVSKFDDDLSLNDRINKHFESTKIYDDDIDFGYGDKMSESTEAREDFKFNNIFQNRKFDNKSFNNIFDKNVTLSREVVKHQEPKPMILAKSLAYSEIGAGKNNDYSSSVEKSKNLAYTDYMKAHSLNRLVDSTEFNNIKNFKDTDEYKKYSDKKIKKKFSSKELKIIEDNKLLEEKLENERLERIKKKDIQILDAYNKANALMLK